MTLHCRSFHVAVLSILFIVSGAVMLCAEERENAMLAIGDVAPPFSLKDDNGIEYTLADSFGKHNVVVVFYPSDNTPICTKQLCAIRDEAKLFEEKNARVFGVNPGKQQSHRDFSAHHGFPFPLLVDEEKKVTKAYGCDGWPRIKRTVYVIDTAGKIVFARRGRPTAKTILKAIQ